MSAFDAELQARLEGLEQQNLFRRLRRVSSPQQPRIEIEGRDLLNFSSNDYLGLATHPKLKRAASEATENFGTGAGASRLISGSLAAHHELEEELAAFKRTEAALTFSSGYATALGVIPALVGKEDVVVLDKLVHASIVDAARLSGATLRIFHHNDLDDLEAILRRADARPSPKGKVLVVTETIFSMHGDFAPIREIVALKERYGAWLMIDEAHATGLFGPGLRGLAEEAGVSDRVEVQMGTLGKALGSAGGYIAGSRALISYLINKARSFIFSTAPPPSISAAARAALAIIDSPEGLSLVHKLRANIALFTGVQTDQKSSPIVPIVLGDESTALAVAERLRALGVFVPAVRFPTVPRGKARLRFTISSAHSAEEIRSARTALEEARR